MKILTFFKTHYYSVIFFLVLAYFLFLLLGYHYSVINYPFQLEYREGAPLLLANELSKGNLPFTLQNQPYLSDVFGCMYSILAYPFLKIFGIKLFSLRLLTGFSILLSSFIFYRFLRFYTISKSNSLFFSVIFYSACLFSCIPISRPDSLGFLFFILSFSVAIKKNFTSRSLVFSLLFSLLAYYTKSYFLVSFPIILFYIFLFDSKRKSVYFAVLFFLSLLISQILIHFIFDFYFIGTFATQLSTTVYEFSHVLNQLNFYFIQFGLFPFVFVCFLILVKLFNKRKTISNVLEGKQKWLDIVNYSNFDKPLFTKTFINVNIFIFIFCLFILVYKIGGHTGNFGVYFIHFLSFPFFFLAAFYFDKYVKLNLIKLICLGVIVLKITTVLPIKFITEPTKKEQKTIHEISNSKQVLSTPIFASVLINQNKKVYQSGLTEYFSQVSNFESNAKLPSVVAKLKDKLFLNKIKEAKLYQAKYLHEVKLKVEQRKFDLILIDTSIYDNWIIDQKILFTNYKITDSLSVHMFATYEDWKVYIMKPVK